VGASVDKKFDAFAQKSRRKKYFLFLFEPDKRLILWEYLWAKIP
jgi:hypothetical protein